MGRKKRYESELIAGWCFRNVRIEMYGNAQVSPRLWIAMGSCFPVLWHRGDVLLTFDADDEGSPRWTIVNSPTAGQREADGFELSATGKEDEFLHGLYRCCYSARLPAHDVVTQLIGTIDLHPSPCPVGTSSPGKGG